MEVVVQRKGWEEEAAEIQCLLANVVQHFLRHFSKAPTGRIKVQFRANEPPLAVFRTSRADDYLILLSAEDRLWAKFAYQFAHEFCHILCDFEKPRAGSNQWFQESLCELGSLFALKQMAVSWQMSPPYSNWRDYAASLDAYANEIINRPEHRLPDVITLGRWLQANHSTLRADSCVRPLNALVAIQLLPLFEAEPQQWEAVQFISDSGDRFNKFLSEWQRTCPDGHKQFVTKVADLFGIKF